MTKNISTFLLIIILSTMTYAKDYRNGVTHISQQETLNKIENHKDQVILIDVRTPREYRAGHLPNAINIPHNTILNNIDLLQQYKDKDIILYCHSGVRVGKVTDKATANKTQLKLFHIKGDYRAWRAKGLPISKP